MNRTSKILLALSSIASVVLSVVVWTQSNRILQLERDVYPERTAKAGAIAFLQDSTRQASIPDVDVRRMAEAGVIGKRSEKEGGLAGEIQFRLPAGKPMDSGLCRFSRSDETQLVSRLQAVTGTRYHNFGVSYWSDGTIRVSGVAPVVEQERVVYELRQDPARKNVWQTYRVIETGDGSGSLGFLKWPAFADNL